MNLSSRQNPRYDVIIFDLDGTLIDSRLDLANSVNFTRQQMGLSVLTHDLIYSYIGDGATLLIRRAMGEGLAEEDVKQALDIFLKHYGIHLLDNTVLYPGVRETLDQLGDIRLAVLTNKPLAPTTAILQGLGIHEKFALVYGGNSFEQKKPDPIGINKILSDTGAHRERALMVGDSRIDIQTGQNAGVATCGVRYGLASETLGDLNPDFLIDEMGQLSSIVFGEPN